MEVDSPWCLWGRLCLDSDGQHEELQLRMNLYYLTLDTTPLKPCAVLPGQVLPPLLLTSTLSY